MFDDDDQPAFVPAPKSTSHAFSDQLSRPNYSRNADEPEYQDGAGRRGAPRFWQAQSEDVRVGVPSQPSSSSPGALPGNQPVLLNTIPVLNQHDSGARDNDYVDHDAWSPESSRSGAAFAWPLPPWSWSRSREHQENPKESPVISREPPPISPPRVTPPRVTPPRAISRETPRDSPVREEHLQVAPPWDTFDRPAVPAASPSYSREAPSYSREAPANPLVVPLDIDPVFNFNREPDEPPPAYPPAGNPPSTHHESASSSGRMLDPSIDRSRAETPPLDSAEAWDVGDGEGIGDGGLLPIHTVSHTLHPGHRPKKEHHQTPLGRIFYEIASGYGQNVPARRPGCCAVSGIIFVLIVTGVGMALLPPEVDTDFSSFMKTDVNSSNMRDGFMDALEARHGDGRRLQGATLYSMYDILIAYELKPESGLKSIFDKAFMTNMASFERELTGLPEWQEYCKTTLEESQALCLPGLSVASYTMPFMEMGQDQVVPSKLIFNGQGRDMVPLKSTLKLLKQHRLERLLLPNGIDLETPEAAEKAQFVRSAFRFRFFCCTSMDPASYQREEVRKRTEVFDKFLKDAVLPFLEEYGVGKKKPEELALPFNIWYIANGLAEIEVMATLFADMGLAAGSMFFVFLYVMFHTRSIFLSVVGLFLVLISVPFSYVVFAIVAGTRNMSIASFLSLFLVVGLGSDVIFVYTDLWRDSIRIRDNEPDRIVWTLFYAGKASLATTITTALSFFANLASVLKPLREFGTYMGLCVVLVWVLITLIFLPICVVDERFCRCCNLGCADRSGRTSKLASILGSWESILFRWRRACLGVSMFFAAAALLMSALSAEVDTDVPNIFPKDHNQNRGKEVMSNFASTKDVFDALFALPPSSAQVCQEYDFDGVSEYCSVFWCEVNPRIESDRDRSSCQCFQRETDTRLHYSDYSVVQRFIGASISDADMSGSILNHVMSRGAESQENKDLFELNWQSQKELAPMILQEWETGSVQLESVTEVTTNVKKPFNQTVEVWEELCFCGTYVCKLPRGFWPVKPLTLSRRRLEHRALQVQPQQVATNKQVDIAVVFGIKVEGNSPLLGKRDAEEGWSFLPGFQAAQPWAQRNIIGVCDNTPPELRVVNTLCFLQAFRDWIQLQGSRFPVPAPQFDSLAMQFSQVGLVGLSVAKDYIWVQNGKVMATFVTMYGDVSKHAPSQKALKYKEHWDKFVAAYNEQASRFARGAWHTSRLWVQAEAQEELISSTVVTLLIVIIMAFLGMLVFTFDPLLSLFVVASTIGVICGLFFFMTCVMRWAIGPIEVIALIVFIGYAVTYSLHITHKYGDGEAITSEPPRLDLDERTSARYQRTGFALKSIGSAAVGSAVTTMGCSVFLLFCKLTIFQKLGGVVLAVTVMSITTALAPLPAALLSAGPLRPGKKCCPTPEDCESCMSVLIPCISGTLEKQKQRSEALRAQRSLYPPPVHMPDSPSSGSTSVVPTQPGAMHGGHYADNSQTHGREAQVAQGQTMSVASGPPMSDQVPQRDGVFPARGHREQAALKFKGTMSEPKRPDPHHQGSVFTSNPTSAGGRRVPHGAESAVPAERQAAARNRQDRTERKPVEVRDLHMEFWSDTDNSWDVDIGTESALDPIQVRQAQPMGQVPDRYHANHRPMKPGGTKRPL